MENHGTARQTSITWEPVVDLRDGVHRGHRARIEAPQGVSAAAAAAQALQSAVTVSALPLGGRLLVLPLDADDVASPEVAATLDLAHGGLSRVVVELHGDPTSGRGDAARTLRAAGCRVALADDVASELGDWDSVAGARRAGADWACGPVIGVPSAAFRGPCRDVTARLRGDVAGLAA